MTAFDVVSGPVAIENPTRTTWYVRPEGSGPYGDSSGFPYENAFEGLENLTFGDGAGDIPERGHTIFICGEHQVKQAGFNTGTGVINALDGEEGSHNVWRGDAVEEAGIVYGGYVQTDLTWTLDTDATYTATLPGNFYGDNWFDLTGGGFQRLVPQASIAAAKAAAGSVFSTDYLSSSTIYVHLFDGSDPNTNDPMMSRFGYRFNYVGLNFVDFAGIKFQIHRHMSADGLVASNCFWSVCEFNWGETYLFPVPNECSNLTWLECKFTWGGNGIYFLGAGAQQTCIGYRIERCIFDDIGNRDIDENTDSHGVGVQGTQDGIIISNKFRRCGRPIVLFVDFVEPSGPNQIMRNILIKLNDIGEENGRITQTETTPGAIEVQFDNDFTGETPDIVIQKNIISDYHIAIRYNSRTQGIIDQNIIDNCNTALQMSGFFANGDGSNVRFHGQTITGTNTRQIDITTAGKTHIIDSDDNTFGGVDVYRWDRGADIDFVAWQALVDGASVFDPNSTGP